MHRLARIGTVLISFLLLVILIAVLFVVVIIRRPFPKTAGTLQVAGLQSEVEVIRDEYGIPHIYAQNEDDLFFTQGYVHAQDRFWQMEQWRRQSQGRLSEMLGEPSLEIDKFLRNVGFNRAAATHLAYYEANEPEFMAILQAYSRGVNAYIAENEAALSVHMTLLGLMGGTWEIEPWEPLDTIAWGVAMAWDLKGSGNMLTEQQMAKLYDQLGEGMTTELLPFYPFDRRPPIVSADEQANSFAPSGEMLLARQEPPPDLDWSQLSASFVGQPPVNGLAFGTGESVGSNSWVVSGQHTASGLPLFANDPHLAIQMPSIWYEVGLHAPGLNVTGFSFAGAPGVVIGHNEHITWGFTNIGPDVQDLYIEKLNPDDPLQYEFQGEWRDIQVIEEIIKVKGQDDVVLNVHLTHHGPILNTVDESLTEVLSLRWTVFEPSRTLAAILRLNYAENYAEFREAAKLFDVPTQNMLYADVAGNIAYQAPGLIPIRPQASGLAPVPGWTGEHEWQGWIPFEDLPAALNPEKGYIVTANNSVGDRDYPYQISLYWANGDRAQRITDMIETHLATGTPFTVDDFARMQFDGYSMLAATYVPLLQELTSQDPQIAQAIQSLSGWDYQESMDSGPAALFEIFYMQLASAVLADDLGQAIEDFPMGGSAQRVFFHALADQPEAHWWDNINTADIESRQEILLQAMDEAITWLEENVGDDPADWSWGAIHTATFSDAVLGRSGVGPVEAMVNRGPFPAAGGTDNVNATAWSWDEPAEVVAHPSMRMIVDLADLDASLSVIPTGQSGHPYHRHYDDEIALWLAGEYHPMRFGQDAVQAGSQDRLMLQPAD